MEFDSVAGKIQSTTKIISNLITNFINQSNSTMTFILSVDHTLQVMAYDISKILFSNYSRIFFKNVRPWSQSPEIPEPGDLEFGGPRGWG